MSIKTRRYRPEDASAIERLNHRLEKAGSEDRVYPEDSRCPENDGNYGPMTNRLWVAAGREEIHGGVWLKEHDFWAEGRSIRAGWMKYPVAESVIDKKFGGVPASLIFRLVRQQPNLMAIGMGGHTRPVARLLAAMGWDGFSIPLYCYIAKPTNLLSRSSLLKRSVIKQLLEKILIFSGAGWIGTRLLCTTRKTLTMASLERYHLEFFDQFGSWADSIWDSNKQYYSLLTTRNTEMLEALYPPKFASIDKIRVSKGKKDIGWACVAQQGKNSTALSRFGTAKVGIIFDCFGNPEDAVTILAAATDFLIRANMDVILLNIYNPAWEKALKLLGYIQWNGNYAFYRSPTLTKYLNINGGKKHKFFFTVADSHSPEMLRVHLKSTK